VSAQPDLLLQLQLDLLGKLNSEPSLQYNAVVSYRQEVILAAINRKLAHLTAKGGKKGCGAIINMPVLDAVESETNIFTPQSEVLCQIDCIEQPEINFASNGTQITAEQLARQVRICLHSFQVDGKLTLWQDARAIEPLLGIEDVFPHCLGYRVNLRGRMSDLPQPKSVLPIPSHDHGQLFFNGADPGAAIYYTLDGSFPGPGNAAAILYNLNNPPNVAAGATVRYAAYTPGSLGSDVGQGTTD
jgi:hypothetical protein